MVPLHGLIRHLDFVDAQGCSVISCLLLNSKSITIEKQNKNRLERFDKYKLIEKNKGYPCSPQFSVMSTYTITNISTQY